MEHMEDLGHLAIILSCVETPTKGQHMLVGPALVPIYGSGDVALLVQSIQTTVFHQALTPAPRVDRPGLIRVRRRRRRRLIRR